MTNGGSNKNETKRKRHRSLRLGELDVGNLNAPMIR